MRLLIGVAALSLLAAPALAQQTTPAPTAPAAPANPGGTQPGSASNPGGMQTATSVGSMQLTFYTVQPTDAVTSRLRGVNVYNAQNESVGEIEDFVIENGRIIKAVVIGVGGFLGLGERYVAVDPNSVTLQRQADGSYRAMMNGTRDSLRNAPAFSYERRR